jgi:ABC-type amino acid transport substrate-binding protein
MKHRRFRLPARLAGLVLLALWLVANAPAWAQAPSAVTEIEKRGTLRVGWAVLFPYMYRNPENNQLTGFAVDFMGEMAPQMNAKLEWVEDNWSTMIAGIQSGKYDVTLPALAQTLPRALAVTFTEPVARQPLGLMVLKKNVGKYTSWQDLDKPGVRITTTLGSNVDMFATRRFKQAELIRVKAGPDSIAQVLTGKADAWANAIEAFKLVQTQQPDLAIVPGPTFGSSPIAMAVRQGDFVFRDWINMFIEEAKATGSLQALIAKHNLFEWKGPLAGDQ